MSGTSLDGLDIAQVSFAFSSNQNIDFHLINCKTYALPKPIFEKLSNVFSMSAMAVFELDQELAHFYAACIAQFIAENNIKQTEITAIASHGQTIFHQPNKGYTTQIGCGSTLNFLTKIPVINQFRQLDVSAGGQGAPLVPLGDALLFAPFADGFLNLGGFANISTQQNSSSIAYDIAPANLPMNQWMQQLGRAYDANGELAREGKINEEVLTKVLALDFFSHDGPKSLGTEWLESTYMPCFENDSIPNKLRTHLEVLKTLCIRAFEHLGIKSVYVTGGGAFNDYFIELLSAEFKGKLIIPDADIINYKEAIIFAFLGARFLRNETTTLSAVTGATEALRTGVLHDFQASIG
jgi:anhydro-N-acetylmuramic acid kinase